MTAVGAGARRQLFRSKPFNAFISQGDKMSPLLIKLT